MQPWSLADLFQGTWLYALFFVACLLMLLWAVWSGRIK